MCRAAGGAVHRENIDQRETNAANLIHKKKKQ